MIINKNKVKGALEEIAGLDPGVGSVVASHALEVIKQLERASDKLDRKRRLNADQVRKLTKRLKGAKKSVAKLAHKLGHGESVLVDVPFTVFFPEDTTDVLFVLRDGDPLEEAFVMEMPVEDCEFNPYQLAEDIIKLIKFLGEKCE